MQEGREVEGKSVTRLNSQHSILLLLNSYLLLFLNLGKLQIVRSSGLPRFYKKDVRNDLECHFSGWPLPREVQWSKNGKIITNGTERIYHSEDRKWEKGKETLRSTLHLPPGGEEQEGDYKCSARNSITGWESEAIGSIEMIYQCKRS